ncbi:MAG: hypothetical protein HFG26_04975 [Provencibacterium sp.]|nr:hypothetical protein [Provencibacterium sp.]
MHNVFIILNQVLIMGLIALGGFVLVRFKKLDPQISRSASNILLYIVAGCIILNALQRDFDPAEARGLALAFLFALLSYLICILGAHLVIRTRGGNANAGIERFGMVMPNAGYIGIPLVQAVLGTDGVFYLTAYIVCFNIMLFSYGRYQLLSDGAVQGRGQAIRAFSRETVFKSLVNPATLCTAAGLILYAAQVRLPSFLLGAVKSYADLNTVLSMLLIGIFLSQTDLQSLLHFGRGFFICFMRLIVLPLFCMLAIALLDVSALTPDPYTVKTAMVIAATTPCAVATAFMSEVCNADHLYGSRLVSASTIFSILTLPIMLLVWEAVYALFH